MDLSEAFILGHCSGLFLALILFLVIWMLQRQVARRTVRRVLDEFLQEQAAERCGDKKNIRDPPWSTIGFDPETVGIVTDEGMRLIEAETKSAIDDATRHYLRIKELEEIYRKPDTVRGL